MELSKYEWMDLIRLFFKSKNIELGSYKFGMFDDENVEIARKVAIITLENPISESNGEFKGATKFKIHYDNFHFWCTTTHEFRDYKVLDEEWINFLKLNHPNKEEYERMANMFLFTRSKEKYETEILNLNCEILRCKNSIEKSESKIEDLELKLIELAREYNVSVYKDGNAYRYKMK